MNNMQATDRVELVLDQSPHRSTEVSHKTGCRAGVNHHDELAAGSAAAAVPHSAEDAPICAMSIGGCEPPLSKATMP